jgi:hypothetical protein
MTSVRPNGTGASADQRSSHSAKALVDSAEEVGFERPP